MDSRNKKSEKTLYLRKKMCHGLWLFLLFFVVFLFVGVKEKKAQAASASISIETKAKQVVKGDTVYVIITVKSIDAIKSFNGYFSYDNRYLQFVSGGSVVHGNDDKFLVDDINRTESATKIKYSIKFKARKKGSTTIALQKPYKVCADDSSSSEMSVSYNSLTVSVVDKGDVSTEEQDSKMPVDTDTANATKSPEKVSEASPTGKKEGQEKKKEPKATTSEEPQVTRGPNDIAGSSKLRSITITDAEIAPEFQPDIKKYSGIVSTNNKALDITYEAQDCLATVTVHGNKNLDEGKHTIKVVVTGTNGRKMTYVFSMTVQPKNEEDTGANGIHVTQSEGKTYLAGTTQIELLEPDDSSKIPDGFEKVTIDISGEKITAYALDGGTDYDYVLLYGKGNEEGFYLYDKNDHSVMPYDKVKNWYRSSTENEENSQAQTIKSYKYIIAIMAVLCVLMLIITISFGLQKSFRMEMVQEIEEPEELEEETDREDR